MKWSKEGSMKITDNVTGNVIEVPNHELLGRLNLRFEDNGKWIEMPIYPLMMFQWLVDKDAIIS